MQKWPQEENEAQQGEVAEGNTHRQEQLPAYNTLQTTG